MPGSDGTGARSAALVQPRVRHRVILLSDRDEWVDSVRDALRGPRYSVERASWGQAQGIRRPFRSLVADVVPPLQRCLASLTSTRHRVWHRLGICVVPGELGATAAAEFLETAAFRVIRVESALAPPPIKQIGAALRDVIEKKVWMLPRLVDALGCVSDTLIRYLEAALTLPPLRTVGKWAEALGESKPQRISAHLRDLGLPPAKEMLSWILLARVVVEANEGPSKTYDGLARAFGYSSGDYLGRHVKHLTGRSLGELIDGGLEGVLELMRERLRPRPLSLQLFGS